MAAPAGGHNGDAVQVESRPQVGESTHEARGQQEVGRGDDSQEAQGARWQQDPWSSGEEPMGQALHRSSKDPAASGRPGTPESRHRDQLLAVPSPPG